MDPTTKYADGAHASPPSYLLWNPTGLLLLSILLSYLPAAILYAMNWGRLGEKKRRTMMLIAALSVFAWILALGFFVNSEVTAALFMGLNIGAAIYFRQSQVKIYREHLAAGGRKASFAIPVFVSPLAVLAIILINVFLSLGVPAQKVTVPGGEVYYTPNVTADEAQKLGDYLGELGFLSEGRAVSVKLDQRSGTYFVSFVIKEDLLSDGEVADSFAEIAQLISVNVFSAPVTIEFCDKNFRVKKMIPGEAAG